MLLKSDQGSTLLEEGDTPNAIVLYNFWHKHRLIAVDPNRPRHFRLDVRNREQLYSAVGYEKIVCEAAAGTAMSNVPTQIPFSFPF